MLRRSSTTFSMVPFDFENSLKFEDDRELPLFDLNTIAAATDNFSSHNKLGAGGFGPVYKVDGNPYLLILRIYYMKKKSSSISGKEWFLPFYFRACYKTVWR